MEEIIKTPTMAEDLKVPTPPDEIREGDREQATNDTGQTVEATESEETVVKNSTDNNAPEGPKEGIVQNHDWNNGRPEVTKEEQEKLDAHQQQTPEVKNDKELRENKGNKEGEPVLEASEEVTTGQNAG